MKRLFTLFFRVHSLQSNKREKISTDIHTDSALILNRSLCWAAPDKDVPYEQHTSLRLTAQSSIHMLLQLCQDTRTHEE